MKQAVRLDPGTDLVQYVAGLLLKEPGRLANNLVIFPGRRPAHFLRKFLADELKKPFRPPRILTADEFIDWACGQLGIDERCIGSIDGVALLFAANRKSKLVADGPAALSLDEFLPWGFKIFSDFEDMCIEGVGAEQFAAVEEIAGEKLPARVRERLVSLAGLYGSFYEDLRHAGLTTRATRYRAVAEGIDKLKLAGFLNIVWAGFFALTKAERTIFTRMQEEDNVAMVFQEGPGIEQTLAGLGIKADKPRPGIRPDISFHRAMDAHSEVMGLNRLIAGRRTKFTRRDVIVLPRPDTLFPVVQHTLGLAGPDHNISMGYPLHRTPIYALIETVGRCHQTRDGERFRTAAYLKVVLHPYVKNIYFGKAGEPTRIIFHALEENLAENGGRHVRLTDIEENREFTGSCAKLLSGFDRGRIGHETVQAHLRAIHQTVFRAFERIKDVDDFCGKLLDLVSFISQESPANRHPYTSPFVKAMIDGLCEMRSSSLGRESFDELAGYFGLFRNFCRTIHYPFPGTPLKGLQVLGFLETRGLRFDTAYLMDVNEGILPGAGNKDDTLLPYAVRRHLGLATVEDRERIFRYYFETLLGGAKTVHVFYIEGADQEKSRFVERLLWQSQQKSKSLAAPTQEIFFNVKFAQTDPAAIAKTPRLVDFIRERVTLSPSRLDVYLACPLRFYYNSVLRLREKEEIGEEMDPRRRGWLVHRILRDFFLKRLGRNVTITREDYLAMDELVDEVWSHNWTEAESGGSYLDRSQMKRRMRDVLRYHAEKLSPGTVFLECENQVRPRQDDEDGPPYRTELTTERGDRVILRGRVDRVDRRGAATCIVDYKTGGTTILPKPDRFDVAERDAWVKTLGSVQLPCYILLYQAKVPSLDITSTDCCLMLLGGRQIEEKFLFGQKVTGPDRAETFSRYRRAILLLIDEILDPTAPFVPTGDPDHECPGCAYRVICGRQWLSKKW